MKSNKTKSAMTALVIAAMICTAAMPVKAEETKWENNNGVWSLVKTDGSKATGWVKDGDCWYAFDENGAMRTGWVASNEHWYYMGESGVMQAGAWVEDNGAQYFIKGTGVMAKDYIKDGYEFTSDGKAIPLSESKSVVLTDASELEGKVIEGNLYVDITTAKEIELKGVTVKGKLVIVGDNETAGKVTLTDSTVETINTQSRNAEVVLSGKTEVKNIVIEETAKVTPDKNYKGEVENIEVQSTTKGEVVIEVPAENVSTRTYATVDIQAKVENLEVKTDTQVKVNADVNNVTVTETAKDTTVEVAKGSTVGTITADAPVKIDGKGTVEKVEANVDGVEASKDTTIKEVETGKDVTEAPDVTKPDKGGSSGGGDYTPTPSYDYLANNEDELIEYLNKATDGQVIKLNKDIEATKKIQVDNNASFTLDGNNKTISGVNTDAWHGEYVLQMYNNTKTITIKNIKLTGGDAGLLVNGANVKLEGTINVSGNEFGGIEVSQGEGVTNHATLDITKATLVNENESMNNPTIWKENVSTASVNGGKLTAIDKTEKNQTYYINVNSGEKLLNAMSKVVEGQPIVLTSNIEIENSALATLYQGDTVRSDVVIDLNNVTLKLTGVEPIKFDNKSLTLKNGNITANDFTDGTKAVFSPETKASITLSNVKMNTTGSALYPRGDTAQVTVENKSEITAGVYAIGTNAAAVDNYGVKITVSDSVLNTTGWKNNDGDDCAVMINVAGTLNITNSTLNGNRQGLVVRAGVATVDNTTINYSGNWAEENDGNIFYDTGWKDGNNLPSAPVVVGSRTSDEVYKAPAVLTLTGCTINGSNNVIIGEEEKEVQVYMYGRGNYHATLNIESPKDGQIYKVLQGEYTTVTGLPTLEVETVLTEAPQEKAEEELKDNSEDSEQTGSTDDTTSENNDVLTDQAAE